MSNKWIRLALVLLASIRVDRNAAYAAEILDLGLGTDARGVSWDGNVVVGTVVSSDQTPVVQAYRWTRSGGLVGLGFPNSPGGQPLSSAWAISGDGSTIAGYATFDGAFLGYRWRAQSGFQKLAGGTGSIPRAVNGDGNVIVGDINQKAALWDAAGNATMLGALAAIPYDYGRGVTADGNLVVGQAQRDSGTRHAYRWTSVTGMVSMDPPDQIPPTDAGAITPDGKVIVGYNYALAGNIGYRWTQATGFVSLDPNGNPAILTNPTAVSADGSTIAGWWYPAGEQTAFVWDAQDGIRSLDQVLTSKGVNVTGWDFREVTGMSADGTVVVGIGTHNNNQVGFYASLVPEPTTFSVCVIAAIAMGLRRRLRAGEMA
jgi:uncharacterized membrane protein